MTDSDPKHGSNPTPGRAPAGPAAPADAADGLRIPALGGPTDRRSFIKGGLLAGGLLAGAGFAAAEWVTALSGGNAAAPVAQLPTLPIATRTGAIVGSGHSSSVRARRVPSARPNVLVILVDQLRSPVWFPATATLDRLLPNIAALRNGAVSFGRHFTAANDCSPSRSALLTGLYTHQTGCMITGGSTLDPGFPTWGSMLREHGYNTYWYGKWHVTHMDNKWQRGADDHALEQYGFSGGTYPSPDGGPGQGWHMDPKIAKQFDEWYAGYAREEPWCTTVSFVNPHDIAWWYRWTDRVPAESSAPSMFNQLPPNFETPEMLMARNKPRLQRSLQNTAAASFGAVPFEGPGVEQAWLPFLDLYLKIQQNVDFHIGRVLKTLASDPEVAANTIVMLTSDHGEYGSSHGLRGKGASAYDEALRVPLMVKDPRGVLTSSPNVERTQLTSSVDVAPLLLTIASGSNDWRRDAHFSHLANRLDVSSILKDPDAPGRPYVLHATDEMVTEYAVEAYAADAPLHVVALRTPTAKYATYSYWQPGGIAIDPTGQETELYDYSTNEGQLETHNSAGANPLEDSLTVMLQDALVNELRQPLPAQLRRASAGGFTDYSVVSQRAASAAAVRRIRRAANAISI